jgi:hypothetical protein
VAKVGRLNARASFVGHSLRSTGAVACTQADGIAALRFHTMRAGMPNGIALTFRGLGLAACERQLQRRRAVRALLASKLTVVNTRAAEPTGHSHEGDDEEFPSQEQCLRPTMGWKNHVQPVSATACLAPPNLRTGLTRPTVPTYLSVPEVEIDNYSQLHRGPNKTMRSKKGSLGNTGDPTDGCAGGDVHEVAGSIRCECGSLLARQVAEHLELKCRRCKRTILVRVVGIS